MLYFIDRFESILNHLNLSTDRANLANAPIIMRKINTQIIIFGWVSKNFFKINIGIKFN
jgi:hypothetical protein